MILVGRASEAPISQVVFTPDVGLPRCCELDAALEATATAERLPRSGRAGGVSNSLCADGVFVIEEWVKRMSEGL